MVHNISWEKKDVCKTLCPLKCFLSQMFRTAGLVSSKYVPHMYVEEIYLGKLLLKQLETVLAHLTRWPWPLTKWP